MPYLLKNLSTLFLLIIFAAIGHAQQHQRIKIFLKDFDYSKIISVTDTAIFFITSSRQSDNAFLNRFYCYHKLRNETETLSKIKGNFNCLSEENFILSDTAFFTDSYRSDRGNTNRLNIVYINPFKKESTTKIETVLEEKKIKGRKAELKNAAWAKSKLGFYKKDLIFVSHRSKELNSFYEIKYRTLDSNGTISQLNEINLPYRKDECIVADIFFDDKQSELYLLLKVSAPELLNKNIKYYTLYRYNIDSKTADERKIDVSEKKFNTHFHLVNENLFLLFFPREKNTTITDSVNLVVFNKNNLDLISLTKLGFTSKVADGLLGQSGSLFFQCKSYCNVNLKSCFLFENETILQNKESGSFNYDPTLWGSGGILPNAIATSIMEANSTTLDASVLLVIDSLHQIKMQAYFKNGKVPGELHSTLVNLNSELILVSNIRDKDKVYKKTFPLWEISTDSLTIDKLKFMHEKKAIEDKYYSSSKYETGNEIYFIGKSKIEGYNSFENYIYIFKK